MAVPKIVAIEYNSMMTLLAYVKAGLVVYKDEYGLSGTTIEVKPAYAPSAPHGLTEFKKPAIILQKIYSNPNKIGMGNVLGGYEYEGVIYDVSGVRWDMVYQFSVFGKTNTDCSLITGVMAEELFWNGESIEIPFMNYLPDINNPIQTGLMVVNNRPQITGLSGNANQDFSNSIRIGFDVIQYKIHDDVGTFDLSKVKFTQQIINS